MLKRPTRCQTPHGCPLDPRPVLPGWFCAPSLAMTRPQYPPLLSSAQGPSQRPPKEACLQLAPLPAELGGHPDWRRLLGVGSLFLQRPQLPPLQGLLHRAFWVRGRSPKPAWGGQTWGASREGVLGKFSAHGVGGTCRGPAPLGQVGHPSRHWSPEKPGPVTHCPATQHSWRCRHVHVIKV